MSSTYSFLNVQAAINGPNGQFSLGAGSGNAEEGITILNGVPATYQRLLEYKALAGLQRFGRGSLRLVAVAGAPLDVSLKSRVEDELGLPLSNAYGITECSPGISGVRFDEPRSDNAVGRVLPGVEARVRTLDGLPLGNGEVGELHVRGRNVMRGYYRAPDLTAKVIDSEGWFNTGDLARFDGDCLYIVGRTKDMIIRSGFNVYPAEIEAVLSAHKDVVQCAVVGRPVEGNEEVVAFVQKLRASTDLFKQPGIAETIDWAHALTQLDVLALTPEAINDTLGVLLKYQDDIAKIQGSEAERLLAQVKAELATAG